MTATSENGVKKRPFLPWFGVFLLAMFAMAALQDYFDIEDTLIRNLMMLAPMIFIVKAGLNAMHNAGKQGAVGSPMRNYLKRMLIVSLSYVGSLFAAASLIEDGDPVTVLSVLIALVPGLAVAGYFWAIARLLIEIKDEFLRMLQIRQALIATALSLSAASVWGFLENFEQVPHVDAYWWPIVWFFGLGVGALANKITFGTIGEC